MNDDANGNNAAGNYRLNNKKTAATSKSFEYKTKIIGRAPDDNNRLDTKVVVPLKHLNNFWRSLDLPFINCEEELDFRRIRNCIIPEISRTAAVARFQVKAITTTSASFEIKNAKLYRRFVYK